MSAAFIYLAIGAVIVGLFRDSDDWPEPVGYVVLLLVWPFLGISVAVQMIRDAVRRIAA